MLAGHDQAGHREHPDGRKERRQGTLKAYAVAAPERLPQFPDVPTLKELGTDMTYSLDRGIVAPKGTDPAVIEMWSQMFKAAAEDPELLASADSQGHTGEVGRTGSLCRMVQG